MNAAVRKAQMIAAPGQFRQCPCLVAAFLSLVSGVHLTRHRGKGLRLNKSKWFGVNGLAMSQESQLPLLSVGCLRSIIVLCGGFGGRSRRLANGFDL